MLNVKDEDILKKIQVEREITDTTLRRYRSATKIYTKLTGHHLNYLIEEAIAEEGKHIPWRDKHLREYLVNFRSYLYKNYQINTAKTYMTTIKSIYTTYEIEMHPLPRISEKKAKKSAPLRMNDLLTKDEINRALDISIPVMKSLILFFVSTGTDRSTALNITVEDFLKATKQYHSKKGSITEILEELLQQDDIVPTFYLRRLKTNEYYFTFASPEWTKYCCKYLLNRKDKLTPNSKLFQISASYVVKLLEMYNQQLNLGSAGTYIRLRCHMFRKYHATMLDKSKYLDKDMIDELQGRKQQVVVRQAYYLDDPVAMKKAYIKSLDYITIRDVNIVTVESDEYRELKKEYEKTVNDMKKMKKEYKSIAKEQVKEEFRQLLAETRHK